MQYRKKAQGHKKTKFDKLIKWLHHHFKDPQLWAYSRQSVSRGVAAGLLVAFNPFPAQIFIAPFAAILLRGNILAAVTTTCISNPFTFIPINYFILEVGEYLYGQLDNIPPPGSFELTPSDWPYFLNKISPKFREVGRQYIVGMIVVSLTAAFLGFVLVQTFWNLIQRLHKKGN